MVTQEKKIKQLSLSIIFYVLDSVPFITLGVLILEYSRVPTFWTSEGFVKIF